MDELPTIEICYKSDAESVTQAEIRLLESILPELISEMLLAAQESEPE